jgi:hypothetical protein
MFFEPSEDRLVSGLRALACLGEPTLGCVSPEIRRPLAEANLPPRTRASYGFNFRRFAAISRASRLAKPFMWLMNSLGVFNNRSDNARDLKECLETNFRVIEFDVVGVTAFFAVKKS